MAIAREEKAEVPDPQPASQVEPTGWLSWLLGLPKEASWLDPSEEGGGVNQQDPSDAEHSCQSCLLLCSRLASGFASPFSAEEGGFPGEGVEGQKGPLVYWPWDPTNSAETELGGL